MAISAMIMAINGNDNGHTGHTNANANGQNCNNKGIIMAILAMIIAINGNANGPNGNKNCHYGNNHGNTHCHKWQC